MNLLISADIRGLMTRTITCLETANAMTHNETTWEKKQEIITTGLQVLSDYNAEPTEIMLFNVTPVFEFDAEETG